MNYTKYFIIFSFLIVVSFSFQNNVFGQQTDDKTVTELPPPTPQKKILIQELRELLGITKLTVKMDFKSTTANEIFMSLIDNEKELNEEQKKDLRLVAIECLGRFEKSLSEFMNDPTNNSNLFEEVSINYFDQNFTENELKELITFLQTPTGKKTGRLILFYNSTTSKTFNSIFSKRFANFTQIKGKEEEAKLKLKIQEMKTLKQ